MYPKIKVSEHGKVKILFNKQLTHRDRVDSQEYYIV